MPARKKPEPPTRYLAIRWSDDGQFAVLMSTPSRDKALAVCRFDVDFVMAIPDETPGRFRACLGYYPLRPRG